MSATLHVSSQENPYVAECLRLGILAARQRPKNEDDWDTTTIEEVCIRLMQELGDSSSSGESYVEIPGIPPAIREYEEAWMIWSGEWNLWWRENAQGYTRFTAEAGRFTKAEAESYLNGCGPMKKLKMVEVGVSTPDPGCEACKSGLILSVSRKIHHTCGKEPKP